MNLGDTSISSSVDSVKTSLSEINIHGIDIKKGLALYGGDCNVYLSVLRSFVSNALDLIKKLKNVTAQTLPHYAINVHGLKGICAGIGAQEVMEAAFYLEKMSKANNLEEVLLKNDSLIQDAEKLASNTSLYIEEYDKKNAKPLLPSPDKKLLVRLRECSESYDIDGIDEVMDKLEKFDYNEGADLVVWLRKTVIDSDFSQIVTRLSEIQED